MMKLLIIFVVACVCLLEGSAQQLSPQNRRVCERLNRQCLREEPRVGRQDVITMYVNRDCRQRERQWTDVSRCQFQRAGCEITLARCGRLTCAQVARALRR